VSEIWVERRKWPDIPHYRTPGWVLGEDEYGLWIELRVGSPVYRGEEVLFLAQSGGVVLAPNNDGWAAWFPRFGEHDLYVDIVTGLTRSERAVTMVDLDLDVVRFRTGEVQLLDEDEFEAHQVKLGYTPEMIDFAERNADFVLEAVKAGREPFDGVRAAEWAAGVQS
jgi:uncharacterized protein